jgi:uncharacterized membrane protein
MDEGFAGLAVAALLWMGAHIGIAGTALRQRLSARLGESGFRAAFSALSILLIVLLVRAYNGAGSTVLWFAPGWLRWLLVLAMLPAFVLFVASITNRNPTMIGGGAAARQEPRGIQRVTRHPMLWSFAVWAGVHMLANGDAASLVFFGAFLVTALAGMPSIDAKLAARDREAWAQLDAYTSIFPFAAIASGRNFLSVREIGWLPFLLGFLAWAAMLHFHRVLIGVPAVPIAS